MTRPDLVIFDMDGVLVDSEVLSVQNLVREVGELGLELTVAEARQRWLGMSWADLFGRIEADLGEPLPAGWTERVLREERAVFALELQPVAGARAMLRALRAASLRRCVASSEDPVGIDIKLGATDLRKLIDGGLYSARMVEHGKPAPDLVLHAARQEGVDPARCVVVEDAPRGVAGAVAAGMRALAYAGDAHADRAALSAAGGELFDDMAALPSLLGL
jgi:HAD superfamily hydrolase (TIGR01509 family)